MISLPQLFISAVSKELGGARQIVANTLLSVGYEPVWQDILGTEHGDIRAMLRAKIDPCEYVIQLVGFRYGAEPRAADADFGRVSYTQYEALYALQQGKKVVYLIDTAPSSEDLEPEPEEFRRLQEEYRARIKAGDDLYHEVDLTSNDSVKLKIHEIKNKLEELRRKAERWAKTVTLLQRLTVALVAVVVVLIAWLIVKLPSAPASQITAERADAAFIAKDYPAAFDVYAQLSETDPANIEYHRRVEESARLGRLERPLLDRYLALVQKQPDNAVYRNYLGNAYLMLDPQDKDGKAREQYESAMRLDSTLSSPLSNLGILAFRAGKTDDAESLFKRYLALESSDAQGWVNLGLLYVSKMQPGTPDAEAMENAESAFRKALALDPGSSAAYKGLGRLCATADRKSDALNAYQRSLALNYEQPDVRQQVELLAWESSGTRLPSQQADDFKTRGAAGDDANAPAAIIAMRQLEQGQFQEAEATCRNWIQGEPENPLAWRVLSVASDAQGRAEEAREHMANALRLAKAGGSS